MRMQALQQQQQQQQHSAATARAPEPSDPGQVRETPDQRRLRIRRVLANALKIASSDQEDEDEGLQDMFQDFVGRGQQ